MNSKAERLHLYLALLLFAWRPHGHLCFNRCFLLLLLHEFALIPTFLMIGIWGRAGRRIAAIEMTIYLTLGALLSLLDLSRSMCKVE